MHGDCLLPAKYLIANRIGAGVSLWAYVGLTFQEAAMFRAILIAILLLFPLALAAQSLGANALQLPSQANAANGSDCPVSMNARQGVWDRALRVDNEKTEKQQDRVGQRLNLTLSDRRSLRIVDATVKVLGLSGKNRVLGTGLSSNGYSDASRVVHLTSFSRGDQGATADLYAPGFTSVTSIQLLAISYADGSTWTASQPNGCRVSPDPMMLIAAH
jgi:hypothetical protein